MTSNKEKTNSFKGSFYPRLINLIGVIAAFWTFIIFQQAQNLNRALLETQQIAELARLSQLDLNSVNDPNILHNTIADFGSRSLGFQISSLVFYGTQISKALGDSPWPLNDALISGGCEKDIKYSKSAILNSNSDSQLISGIRGWDATIDALNKHDFEASFSEVLRTLQSTVSTEKRSTLIKVLQDLALMKEGQFIGKKIQYIVEEVFQGNISPEDRGVLVSIMSHLNPNVTVLLPSKGGGIDLTCRAISNVTIVGNRNRSTLKKDVFAIRHDIDLTETDLSDFTLKKAIINRLVFRNTNLVRTVFDEVEILQLQSSAKAVKTTNSVFSKVNFVNSDLSNSTLNDTFFENSGFENSNLSNVSIIDGGILNVAIIESDTEGLNIQNSCARNLEFDKASDVNISNISILPEGEKCSSKIDARMTLTSLGCGAFSDDFESTCNN